jgi:hypothetical protein
MVLPVKYTVTKKDWRFVRRFIKQHPVTQTKQQSGEASWDRNNATLSTMIFTSMAMDGLGTRRQKPKTTGASTSNTFRNTI